MRSVQVANIEPDPEKQLQRRASLRRIARHSRPSDARCGGSRAGCSDQGAGPAGILYFPNSAHMNTWIPQTKGEIATLPEGISRTLEPLAKYRSDISVLGGLTVNGGRALRDALAIMAAREQAI